MHLAQTIVQNNLSVNVAAITGLITAVTALIAAILGIINHGRLSNVTTNVNSVSDKVDTVQTTVDNGFQNGT
jgi:hypothetical protein